MALALREEDMAHPIRSGLASSICLYKPTLIVLLLPMLFVTRRFKTVAGFAAGGLALTVVASAVEGVRVWPGYITMLLSFARGSAGVQAHSFKQAWKYVDFASFASLVPGGRSWLGQVLLFGCAFWVACVLVRVWWKSAGLERATNTMVWATTFTWTLVLNVYVPIYDSILVVPSIIATAGVLKGHSGTLLHRWFTFTWLLSLAVSWITVDVAQASGFQMITVLLAALGILQFAALRQLGAQRSLQKAA